MSTFTDEMERTNPQRASVVKETRDRILDKGRASSWEHALAGQHPQQLITILGEPSVSPEAKLEEVKRFHDNAYQAGVLTSLVETFMMSLDPRGRALRETPPVLDGDARVLHPSDAIGG